MKSGIKLRLRLRVAIVSLMLLFTGQVSAEDSGNVAANQVNNAVSEQRIALVIGNSAYLGSPLKNPVNDAKDVADKLRRLGFTVIERNNLQTKQIGGTLREFRSKLMPGAVALIFYAGHGLQIKGINYLPTVDAEIDSEEDVPNQSISVNQIMDVLDEAKTRLNLVFLDACRNNPYARSFRSSDKGLARVSAPSGTLISYATRPGSVAADGHGRNGLYTSKLLVQMDSNLQIEQTLKRVVTEVKTESQGKQEPWMEGSIEGDFCFAGCEASSGSTQAVSLIAPPRVKTKEEIEQETWESARDSANIGAIQEYLKQYPKGLFAGQARVLIATLKAAPPAKPAETGGQFDREEIEQEVWASARDSANIGAIQEYLKQYPKGRFSGQAKVLIATLKTTPAKPAEPIMTLTREDNETALWAEVQKGSSKDDYEAYLAQFPKGKYAALAKSRIKKLQDEAVAEAERREQEAWEAADKSGSKDGYQGYLKGWPAGRYANPAQEKLAALLEQDAWQQANAGEDAQTVRTYLDKYPNGRYVAAAREKLAALAARQEQELWQQADASENTQAIQAYLDKYPNGRYVVAAFEKLADIAARQEQELWKEAQEAKAGEKGQAVQAYLDKYPAGLYAATAWEELGKMVNVGSFGSAKPGEKEIRCWGFKTVKAPEGEPFSEFIRKAFLNELKVANVYYNKAEVTLTGNLDAVRFSYGSGVWNLELTVKSSNGKSLSVAESYSYKASSSADAACDQTVQAFMPAVQSLVGKIVKSPEFPALVGKSQLDREMAARKALQQEQAAWESANSAATEAGYQDYRNAYPQGHYTILAAARIAKLKKETPQAARTTRLHKEAAQTETRAMEQNIQTGKIFRDCAECPEMVIIPAGSFDMGSSEGGSDEKPLHRVTIKQAFAMGKTEVTQGQWHAVMGTKPSSFTECGDDCPVEQVSWDDAQEFVRRLNQKTGMQYRLPAEAEWEYACRAGGRHEYCGSDDADSVAWHDNAGNIATNPAGRKQANAFGLYDMSGNVWEWVEDSWHDDYSGAPADGSAWQGDSTKRVLRGGSWYLKSQKVRAASRNRQEPAYRGSGSGFRLVKMLP